jgi:hypothetical protein
LQIILSNEQQRGRVECDGRRWRLIPEAFPADVLAALALLDELGSWPGREAVTAPV